jgi:hypothetical protein
MLPSESLLEISKKIQEIMQIEKCRKCGCMKGSLLSIKNALAGIEDQGFNPLKNEINSSLDAMEPEEYT